MVYTFLGTFKLFQLGSTKKKELGLSLKVAIYCVCKNEAANVAAWLDTAKAADVIVAADTGSTDSTPFKFEGRGDKVRSHEISVSPWRFDTARNAALALVPGDVDVCISLDMDERLAPNWRMVLERHWKPGTTRGSTRTASRRSLLRCVTL